MWGVKTVGLENSPTPLIPVIIGMILFVCTNLIRAHHKIVSHIAVVLTLMIVIALIMPFMKAMGKHNSMAMLRMGTMIISSFITFLIFIKSFIDARKAKANRL